MIGFDIVPRARSDLARFDAELARLGRGTAGLRLRLGETLEAIGRTGAHHELGFSSIEAYALERCERSGRWAADTRAVARRLAKLPLVRSALLSGELGWSMVELLGRHARPENEAALLDRARGATVRAMRRELCCSSGDDEPWREIRRSVPRPDAWAFEFTRMLLGAATESRSANQLVEAMLAEGLTALQSVAPQVANDDVACPPKDAAWKAQLAVWRAAAEEACEARVERSVPAPPRARGRALHGGTPRELDRAARALARELAERDLTIGTLFERFRRADGWRRLGWATEEQYARERMGMSHASLKARVALARRCSALPSVGEALAVGNIGYEAATLVARVAQPGTTEAWLARAGERTVKHLRQEIDAVEMVARATGDASVLVPPDDEAMDAYFALESFVLSGPSDRDGQMSGGSGALTEEVERQMSGGRIRPGAGMVALRLRVREEIQEFWHDLEARFARSGLPGSFLAFLCVATWQTWANPYDGERAYAHIYARDGYRCTSPVCPSRCVTPHHHRYRARGGGDEDDNVGSLCLWCHLFGEHQGRLKVEPPASRPRWTLGREPIMVVEHRRRILIDEEVAA